MNWLNIILIYVLNIRSEGDLIKVQKTIFIENDFWCADQKQLKTDKGYLQKVYIGLEREGGSFTAGFNYCPKTCFYLKSTDLGYIVPRYLMIEEDIYSVLKSLDVNGSFLKFRFFFSEKQIERYGETRQEYVTYKLPYKVTENSITLRCDLSTDIRIKHIKERFEVFIWMKLLKFNEYIAVVGENKLKEKLFETKNGVNFDLYYFKNHTECFKNLKKIIMNLYHFKLLEDGLFDSFTAIFCKIDFNLKNTLKVSRFKKRICEKFNENFKKMNDNKADEVLELLFDQCCDYIQNQMLNNNVFLPIGGKYNINYYIEQLSNLINEFVEHKRIKCGTDIYKDKDFIFAGMTCSLQFGLEKLQLRAIKDLCESEFIYKHFSKLLGNKVKTLDDYTKVENMVCDYYNMFAYIINLYYKFTKEGSYFLHTYVPPIFIDNYNLRIINGLKIGFKYPVKFGKITGFNNEKEEVILVKDYDYFINESILYCPSDVLKMKNIQEIEVISSNDEKNNKKFKVNEYLSI